MARFDLNQNSKYEGLPFCTGLEYVLKPNLISTRLILAAAFVLVIVFSNVPYVLGKFQSASVVSERHGYGLNQSREGLPLLVSKWFWNSKEVAQEFTVIFDIRKDDVSVEIFLKPVLADPRTQATAFVPWTPEIPGEYQIRTFVLSNITNPEFLENLTTSRFSVMSDEEFMASYSDRPTSFAITRADAARTSPDTSYITFDGKQYLGSNAFVRDSSVSDDGVYFIGMSELSPFREYSPKDAANKFVFFSASNDRGLTFQPMKYLANNTRGSIFVHHPTVHPVNDTLVYVAWQQEAHHRNDSKLVLTKSLDGGRTFGERINVDGVSGDLDLAFSRDGRSLYVVRAEALDCYPELLCSAIVFTKSNDYAQSFTPGQAILNYTGSEWINCIQITTQEERHDSTDMNNVYLAWRQDSDDHRVRIMFSASDDGGTTFSEPIVISDAYTDDYDCPWLAAYGDDVYLSWAEMKLIYKPEDPSEILVGDTDIFFIASRDSGKSFESPVNLSHGIGAFTSEPTIQVSDGRIYAVWRDTIPEISEDGFLSYYGNAEVVMTRSVDGGRTFEKPLNLSNSPSGSYEPEIAVHGNIVYMTWMESVFPSNTAEVSIRTSADGGKTFGVITEDILGEIEEPVSRPTVLASPDGERIYVVWSERTAGGVVSIYSLAGQMLEK